MLISIIDSSINIDDKIDLFKIISDFPVSAGVLSAAEKTYHCIPAKLFMQRIVLFSCLVVSLFFSSCGFYAQRQKQLLYTQISATNDTLDRMTREWHQLLDKAVRSKNFSTLHDNRVKIGQFISRSRSAIANAELPPDAEVLRESEGVFLSNQAVVVSDVYPQFESFNELTPDEKIQKTLIAVAGDQDNELAWKLTIRKSLDAFAIKNGIRSSK